MLRASRTKRRKNSVAHATTRAAMRESIHAVTSERTKATRRSPRETATGNRPDSRNLLIIDRDMLVSSAASFREIRRGLLSFAGCKLSSYSRTRTNGREAESKCVYTGWGRGPERHVRAGIDTIPAVPGASSAGIGPAGSFCQDTANIVIKTA